MMGDPVAILRFHSLKRLKNHEDDAKDKRGGIDSMDVGGIQPSAFSDVAYLTQVMLSQCLAAHCWKNQTSHNGQISFSSAGKALELNAPFCCVVRIMRNAGVLYYVNGMIEGLIWLAMQCGCHAFDSWTGNGAIFELLTALQLLPILLRRYVTICCNSGAFTMISISNIMQLTFFITHSTG